MEDRTHYVASKFLSHYVSTRCIPYIITKNVKKKIIVLYLIDESCMKRPDAHHHNGRNNPRKS
jgi:hypothetical protein